ncbi:uncharacterized protein LOC125048305 isoform X2 [Penaeus chinensis]|uniref:uncharacterized protein LOC125048305 isoform X2 n=1 Tax=Penaeus chinensis TaxID=139456 RepID=UPI001FB70523|nr:uncharacterized protein LOC125048305 isoform X2 [Penaeus chinensis]
MSGGRKTLSVCLLVVVVGSCAGQSIQQLLNSIGINNPTTVEEIRSIFNPNNQHNVVSCLVNGVSVDAGRPCDARTNTFRSLLTQLDSNNYNCNCPEQGQVDAITNLIRKSLNPANCNTVRNALQLQNLRC